MFVKRLTDTARIPTRGSGEAAALDLYADETIDLQPGAVTSVRLGIATAFPRGYAAMIWDRSGMGKRGLHVFGGVVDSDYRGEWKVLLYNATGYVYRVRQGDRVAQAVLQAVQGWPIIEVETLEGTNRGDGGFGSTGK